MHAAYLEHLDAELGKLRETGLFKTERVITSPQSAMVTVGGRQVINLCANNYLGWSHSADLENAARSAIDRYGYGLSSVRFICGTQQLHTDLEARLAEFLRVEASILYSSCFDANGGLFETLLGPEDAVISDALNHASIIDGVRLCKAQRFRYANNDMADLARQLEAAKGCRFKLIATDGVFSMDGTIADLAAICDLADRHQALVMVDDSHAVGFIGDNGRGTPELRGVEGRIDILTGTFGKALGGASGGYTAGRRQIVDWLRQRSRPYLFSNSVAPVIAATTLRALELVGSGGALRQRLRDNTRRFRAGLTDLGFTVVPGEHAIVPVMLGDAVLAQAMAAGLFEQGVYAVGFAYPVVPLGKARIRTQMSAGHDPEHIDRALAAFAHVGRALTIIA
ncbi:MAG: glycine C-acetyltransferase [Planctomycetes bacterium]|nr:glycine C-acetyltransferase [Planctomycetota bacterium]